MDDLTRLHLVAMLERDEGRRTTPYQDSRGVWTVGVGHNMEARGFSNEVIDLIRDEDIRDTEQELAAAVPWLTTLDPPRYAVMVNMAFNLGVAGLLAFHHMLAAVQAGNYGLAADHMRDSEWARQVGDRAVRLERVMVSGAW